MTIKLCKNCGEEISEKKYRNIFCSQSCSSSFNNQGVKRHFSKKEYNHCLFCGKETDNKVYCDSKCHANQRWENIKKEIEITGMVYKYGPYFNPEKAKKYLKETRGVECEICKIKTWLSKEVPLVLDHIDGNSDNWELSNLRLICGNCDMQTSTYKGKNKGKGRHYRRERYKRGKSF